jgi:hypothetical protein
LEGVVAEHNTIKCQVELLRQLVEKSGTTRDGEQEVNDFGGGVGSGGGSDDDAARSICTIVPRELERVKEEDMEQIAGQQQQQQREEEGDKEEERRRRQVEPARPLSRLACG